MAKRLLSIWFLLFALAFAGCEKQAAGPQLETLSGQTMGTSYHIKFVRLPDSPPAEEIHELITTLLAGINSQMSTYDPKSELARFNAGEKKIQFSPEVRFVLAEAKRIEQASGGAYDITVRPLVELWGFGTQRRTQAPTDAEIAKVKTLLGRQQWSMEQGNVVVKGDKIQFDLSSIAKGYAVDEVANLLELFGFFDYMVEIGGEVKARGQKPDHTQWVIGVEKPDEEGRSLQVALNINGKAVASSGDYRNFYRDQGKKYSHMIDPITGKPVTHNLAAVTVIHNSCMTADGWATALMILGPDKALEIAQKEGLAVLLLIKEGDQIIEKSTPSFATYLKK